MSRRMGAWSLACCLGWVMGAPYALAQDAARGAQLYETRCGACHYQRIHQRERARSAVQSLADLRAQVARWSAQTSAPFSAQELRDVVEYLNRSHYRLEK